MAILDPALTDELQQRFAETLSGPVRVDVYLKPGSRRLLLPAGMACETCEDVRDLMSAVAETAAGKIQLELHDISAGEDRDVPVVSISRPGEEPRIIFMGLPGGYEFGCLVDALERVSAGQEALGKWALEALQKVDRDLEIAIFTTPT